MIAFNTSMHFKAGTVGRLMPGIEYRLEPVPGVAEGGRLHVKARISSARSSARARIRSASDLDSAAMIA